MRLTLILLVLSFGTYTLGDFDSSAKILHWPSLRVNQNAEQRIIGGELATNGQFPYQAGVRTSREGAERLSYCGGVLISKDYVLTAAHCAAGAEYIIVALGAHEINNEEELGRANVRVEKEFITVHENYDASTITNDIAILKLPEAVEFTTKIQSVALPTWSDVNRNLEDVDAVPSGWGKTANDAETVSPVLKYAEVKVLLQKVCRHFFATLPDSNICTDTSYGNGVCNGDSGGPVVFKDSDGQTKVIGLSSFVSSYGCVRGFPSVYVRITSFLDWIEEHSDIKILDE